MRNFFCVSQLSQALLALKIKGDRRRQKEIKDISFVWQKQDRHSIVLYLPPLKSGYLPLSSYIYLTCET